MFKVGELVIHGTAGVCEVMEIGTPELYKDKAPKLYYTLVSIHDATKIMYTPVDNQKVYLRRAMTKNECKLFIDNLEHVEAKKTWNSRTMMEEFQYDAHTGHTFACASWIKGIYLLQKKKYQNGKKQLTGTEKNCLRAAETYVYEELSNVLGISKTEIKKIVLGKLGVI